MPDNPLPFLPLEWRQSAQAYAHALDLGPLDRLPSNEWRRVLRHVEVKMQTAGVVMPEGWQATLAKQVGRRDE